LSSRAPARGRDDDAVSPRMKATAANTNLDQRRSAARRTALIIAVVAVIIFVLSFAQALSHQ